MAQRLAGCRAALAAAGLPRTELMVPALNYHRSDGAKAMADLLRPPGSHDIAIIGFDNRK